MNKESNNEGGLKNNSPKNGNNFTTGKPDSKPLPNNPAKNAEKTSPEQDGRKGNKQH